MYRLRAIDTEVYKRPNIFKSSLIGAPPLNKKSGTGGNPISSFPVRALDFFLNSHSMVNNIENSAVAIDRIPGQATGMSLAQKNWRILKNLQYKDKEARMPVWDDSGKGYVAVDNTAWDREESSSASVQSTGTCMRAMKQEASNALKSDENVAKMARYSFLDDEGNLILPKLLGGGLISRPNTSGTGEPTTGNILARVVEMTNICKAQSTNRVGEKEKLRIQGPDAIGVNTEMAALKLRDAKKIENETNGCNDKRSLLASNKTSPHSALAEAAKVICGNYEVIKDVTAAVQAKLLATDSTGFTSTLSTLKQQIESVNSMEEMRKLDGFEHATVRTAHNEQLKELIGVDSDYGLKETVTVQDNERKMLEYNKSLYRSVLARISGSSNESDAAMQAIDKDLPMYVALKEMTDNFTLPAKVSNSRFIFTPMTMAIVVYLPQKDRENIATTGCSRDIMNQINLYVATSRFKDSESCHLVLGSLTLATMCAFASTGSQFDILYTIYPGIKWEDIVGTDPIWPEKPEDIMDCLDPNGDVGLHIIQLAVMRDVYLPECTQTHAVEEEGAASISLFGDAMYEFGLQKPPPTSGFAAENSIGTETDKQSYYKAWADYKAIGDGTAERVKLCVQGLRLGGTSIAFPPQTWKNQNPTIMGAMDEIGQGILEQFSDFDDVAREYIDMVADNNMTTRLQIPVHVRGSVYDAIGVPSSVVLTDPNVDPHTVDIKNGPWQSYNLCYENKNQNYRVLPSFQKGFSGVNAEYAYTPREEMGMSMANHKNLRENPNLALFTQLPSDIRTDGRPMRIPIRLGGVSKSARKRIKTRNMRLMKESAVTVGAQPTEMDDDSLYPDLAHM